MSQAEIIIFTASITLLGGSILYIIQRWLENFFWNPIVKQKETIEDIATALMNYANIYGNPSVALPNYAAGGPLKEKVEETINRLRELASLLRVRTDNIKAYQFFVDIHLVSVSKKDINEAFHLLVSLSNLVIDTNTDSARNVAIADLIRKHLKLPNPN